MGLVHEGGGDVPDVIARTGSALLMEYFGDERCAAPMLFRAGLTRDEAGPILRKIIDNVPLWLRNHLVHGDLSPYNLLYWGGRIVPIEFSAAVGERGHPN